MKKALLKRYTPLKARKSLNKVSPKTAEKNEAWAKLDYLKETRAKGLCEIRATDACKVRDFKPDWRGLSKHHIILRSRGRIDTAENCIIGCGDCHDHSKFPEGTPLSILELQEIIRQR